VLCVGTFRPDEGSDAADLAAKLEARGSAEVLPLGHLDPGAVADMALACLGAGRLPASAQSFVAARAEGIPFLVEEVLAGLLGDGALIERDGRWEITGPVAAGVPATFAATVARRLDAVDQDSRRVIRAAAVIGRRFDWSLLSPIASVGDDAVLAALRQGMDLQLIAAGADGFQFRHALTQEAVLAGLLPPERATLAGLALSAVEEAHSGLPGAWCMLAADLAERAGATERAGGLLLEAGRRDLAVGALASAEDTLTRARALAGSGDVALGFGVDEALTEVFAMSGQVDRAIEMGRTLLARIGAPSTAVRSAGLHLRIAQAAIAGGRLADAAASVQIARAAPHANMARVDARAAQVAVGRGDLEEAGRLAQAALRAAEADGLPEVACEALEVIGRVAGQSDLEEAERAYARAESVASAHGLQLWQLRALHEMGNLDMLRTGSLDRLMPARELSAAQGALFLTAVLDLQIASGLIQQFRADEALETASGCADASRRYCLAALPEALIFQAAAHAIRSERDKMEARIAEAIALAPEDRHVLASAWGRCRAVLCLLEEDRAQAWTHMEAGAALLLSSPAAPAPPFLGLWPLLGAALGRNAAAAGQVRSAHLTRHHVIANLLGYTDAVLAGREGQVAAAEAAFAAADAQMGPLMAWHRHYARRIAAEAALADGWGDPVAWLREAAAYFTARGDDRIAGACRALLRRAGAPVPRQRASDVGVPGRLRALSVTGREADVLGLVAQGLTNREIADRMFLSPRTVEKHVASLLAKTGLRRRAQLAGYLAGLDG
jgi:DNA-binding CsgD family transcriptional regulator